MDREEREKLKIDMALGGKAYDPNYEYFRENILTLISDLEIAEKRYGILRHYAEFALGTEAGKLADAKGDTALKDTLYAAYKIALYTEKTLTEEQAARMALLEKKIRREVYALYGKFLFEPEYLEFEIVLEGCDG